MMLLSKASRERRYEEVRVEERLPKGEGRGREAGSPRREGELHFRRLLEKLPAGAYTCDPEGLITYFNEHSVRLWGRAPRLNDPADRYCGSFKLFSVDGATISHDRCWMALALKTDEGYNEREIVVERPDGSRRTALAHANPIHGDSGELLGAVNVLVDITERKRAEEELRMAREAERSRIARELHDGVLQDLAAIVQRLHVARITKARFGERGDGVDVQREIDTLKRAASGLRQAIYDLRSEKEPSFSDALEALLDVTLQRMPGLEIEVEKRDGFPAEVPGRTGRELLGVVREALNNVRRHSAARHAWIILTADERELVVEVADNGRGFEPASENRGLGIVGMRERASMLDGSAEILSVPGRGTSVRITVPRPS